MIVFLSKKILLKTNYISVLLIYPVTLWLLPPIRFPDSPSVIKWILYADDVHVNNLIVCFAQKFV